MENNMFWPLMKDCITSEDKDAMIDFIKNTNRFTNGPKVRELETKWSKWLGCKYSLFVSSGSTANLLLVASIMEKYNLKKGDKIVVPSITWVTNISPIIQLGLQPVFCDIDPYTFSFDLDSLKNIADDNDIKGVFVTHLFGISADIDAYKAILPKAIFIEDVCESHGATYKGKKCGTLSEGSTFSSYFGHHMTTVEGGFVCTNDEDLFNIMKIKRSHGMAREASADKFEYYKNRYPNVHEQFLFVTDGYNFRSMEINAVLGLSQLERLSINNTIRKINFSKFITLVKKYPNLLESNYKEEGNSSFCLPFICLNSSIKSSLEKYLNINGVETRPLCSGNLIRQPFLQKIFPNLNPKDFPKAENLHNNGFFIGNNHLILEEDWKKLENILKSYNNEK